MTPAILATLAVLTAVILLPVLWVSRDLWVSVWLWPVSMLRLLALALVMLALLGLTEMSVARYWRANALSWQAAYQRDIEAAPPK